MSILFYDRPLKHGAAVRSELGLREDGTMRRSVADRRLHGGSLSIGLPDLGPLPTRGPQSAKGYPSSGGCFESSNSRNSAARSALDMCGWQPTVLLPWTFSNSTAEFGSRSSVRGGCRNWLSLRRGYARAPSSLPRLRRSGGCGPHRARMIGLLITNRHGGFRCYRCWGLLCFWLSTQAELLCQGDRRSE